MVAYTMIPYTNDKGTSMSDEDKEVIEDRGDAVEPVEDEEEYEDLDQDEEDTDEEDVESDDDDDASDDDEDEESDDDEDDESEESDEDEDEDDEESDEDEDEGETAEDQRIPKSRLDQVIAQREEERERNLWLQEQLETMIQRQDAVKEEAEEEDPGPPEYDFDVAESKYIELILEGEVKDAAALRREISDARDEVYHYQIDAVKKAAATDAVESTTNSLDEQRFNSMLTSYVKEYSFLDDNSDAYNAKAVTMANKLMASYMAEGKLKSEALKAAVDDVTPLFEKKVAPAKADKGAKRKKQARKKAAKASKAQPPNTGERKGKAARSLKGLSVGGMSDKAFGGLTAREKAKLRGDIV